MPSPVLIEAAINGVVPKAFNPNVPRSAEEITADVLASFEAGASVVHNHEPDGARGPCDVEAYASVWRGVHEALPGAIIYPTIGSSGSFAERFGHIAALSERGYCRIGPIDAGSTNLGVLDELGLPLPSDSVYANSFAFIREAIELCRARALACTFAIFEPTFLHTVLAYHRAGALPQGTWLKFYLGGAGGYAGIAPKERLMPFGLPPTEKALDAYLEILGDCDLPWGVSACAADVVGCGIARAALERGGHLHLGLEMYDGGRKPSNAELIAEAVALCREVGRPPLRWNETADWLGLPPADGAP